jgi:inward rectifier potassium channel
MNQPSFDPGLSQRYTGKISRTINKDGTFNVFRKGIGIRNVNFYQYLINISWARFFLIVIGIYVFANVFFAGIYLLLGVEHLQGANVSTPFDTFFSAFFFSVQTFTTVGYGTIAPKGILESAVASIEVLCGLLSVALATGLLYGRFSRPSAQIIFSSTMIVAPFQERTALMFRIANQRTNMIMELEAKVMLMVVEKNGDQMKRRYHALTLERPSVYFFPLTWTIVHPIEEGSPFFGKTEKDLAELQAEILIMIKGFDDTFSQTVHARYSYRYDEIIWGARFVPAFFTNDHGDMILELERIHDTERIALQGVQGL